MVVKAIMDFVLRGVKCTHDDIFIPFSIFATELSGLLALDFLFRQTTCIFPNIEGSIDLIYCGTKVQRRSTLSRENSVMFSQGGMQGYR